MSVHNDVFINISYADRRTVPARQQSRSLEESMSSGRFLVSYSYRCGCEQTDTDSGAKIPFGFFALSLTMMLRDVRAEECCL